MKANTTKITLSAKELELVCNTDWILTKHTIIKKATGMFSELLPVMQRLTGENRSSLPSEVFLKDPKISKGENYKGLPYVMLDYPRYFEKQDTVAIRTFFWWGHFFSISLQLAGTLKTLAIPRLIANFLLLQQNGYYISVGETPWQHHFEEDNYVLLQNLSGGAFEKILYEKPFVKIGKKMAVQHWDAVTLFIENSFAELISLLNN